MKTSPNSTKLNVRSARLSLRLLLALLALAPAAWAQIVTTITTPGNYTWTCPAGVTSVLVEAWGGGGGGGGVSGAINYTCAGGGAGGSYVSYMVSVTPGMVYNLTVGAGGTGGSTSGGTGGTGGSSYFGNTTAGSPTGAAVLAVGGGGGTGNSGVTAGASGNYTGNIAGGAATTSGNTPSSGTGWVSTAGTAGGTSTGGSSPLSGAGGAAADLSSSLGGGAGGLSVNPTSGSLAGKAGKAPGGGGSGAGDNSTSELGGAGGSGGVTLTYATAVFSATGNSTWTCPANVFSVQVAVTGGGGGGGGCSAPPNYTADGGGAGGSYVSNTLSVTPGTVYNLTVGAGGTGGSISGGNGGTGGSSYFGNTTPGSSSGASLLAVGGGGGTGNSSATAGTSSSWTGGLGGGTATTSGNIAGSGGTSTAGTAGATSLGGANNTAYSGAGGAGAGGSGSSGGGPGGAQLISIYGSTAGNTGTAPGGGGSGAMNLSASKTGGAGGSGRVTLFYTNAVPTAANSTVTANPTAIPADNTTTSTITVTLMDANGDHISGSTVSLASSGTTDTISAASGTSTSAGVVTFTVKSSTGGSATFTATDSTDSITPSQTPTVTFQAQTIDHFVVTPSASSTNAGQVFTATVQAYNANNVAITDNSVDGDIVTMTSSGAAQFDGSGNGTYTNNTMPLTNGTFTINVMDLKAESMTLTATWGTKTGTSSAITVIPAAAAQLQLLLPGETAAPGTASGKTGAPTAQTAGASFNITVNEVDTNWNVVSSSDIVHVVAGNDANAVLPANTALSGGTVALAVTNILAGGGKTLTASDASNASITANTSSSYTVVPGPATQLVLLAPGETATFGAAPGKTGTPNHQVQTVSYTVTVNAVDAYYNFVTNSTDMVGITSTDGAAILPANAALVGGTQSFSLVNNAQGTVTDTATDISNGSLTSGSTTLTIDFLGRYRTVQSGNWGDTSTWQYSTDGGSTWNPAGTTPSSSVAALAEVTNGITVTVAADVAVDRTTVDAGGTLSIPASTTLTVANAVPVDLDVSGILINAGTISTNSTTVIAFESGGTYQHNFTTTAGTIPLALWNPGSTCEIIGYTTQTTAPGNLRQAYYNFTWNCPNQTADLSFAAALKTVNGNLTVLSTGPSGRLLLGKSGILSTDQMFIGGNLIVQGGTLVGVLTSGGPITVSLAGDLLVTGGTLDLADQAAAAFVINASNNVSVTSGTLTSTNTGSINFAKAGIQTFTGGGTISGQIAWTVNSGATLNLNDNLPIAGAMTVAGTLNFQNSQITGAGSLSVSPLGTLIGNGASQLTSGQGTNNFGGTLSLPGLPALVAGNSFELFGAALYTGSFSAISPATPGAGLIWNTSGLTTSGTLAVACDGTLSATAGVVTTPICAGGTLSLTGSAIGGSGSGYGYSWTGPNGFSSLVQNPTIPNATTASSGTYNLTVTDSGLGIS